MNDELFAELMASIEEAGQIAHGEVAAARYLHRRTRAAGCEAHPRRLQSVADPICRAAGHQRQDPAQLGAEPARTCRPRAVLLQVAARHPDAVWDVVRDAAAAGA